MNNCRSPEVKHRETKRINKNQTDDRVHRPRGGILLCYALWFICTDICIITERSWGCQLKILTIKGREADPSSLTVIIKKYLLCHRGVFERADPTHSLSPEMTTCQLVNAASACYYSSINAPSRETAIKYVPVKTIPKFSTAMEPWFSRVCFHLLRRDWRLFFSITTMKKKQNMCCFLLGTWTWVGVSVIWDFCMHGSACSWTLKSPERRRNYGSPGRHSTL